MPLSISEQQLQAANSQKIVWSSDQFMLTYLPKKEEGYGGRATLIGPAESFVVVWYQQKDIFKNMKLSVIAKKNPTPNGDE